MKPHYVDAFPVDTVKDEHVPQAIHTSSGAIIPLAGVLEQCPVVLNDPYSPEPSECLPFAGEQHDTGLELHQPTGYHRRSFELFGLVDLDADSIIDEFGNTYHSLNLKGNNFSHPMVMETSTATDRLIAYGLQESNIMRRVLRASRILRQHNIPTEYIVGLAEPRTYLWPRPDQYPGATEDVSLAEYKRRIIDADWKAKPEEERTVENYVETAKKFERMTFYISARAMDTSFRLDDIYIRTRRHHVFDQVIKHINDNDLLFGTKLDSTSKKDLITYLEDYWAPEVGFNLAKMHHIGLAHKYPNGLNVTALGSIVDCDSIFGEPLGLGDDPINAVDKANDLMRIMDDVYQRHTHRMSIHSRPSRACEILAGSYLESAQELLRLEGLSEEAIKQKLGEIVFGAKLKADEARDNADDDIAFETIPDTLRNIITEEFIRLYFRPEEAAIAELLGAWVATGDPGLEDLQQRIDANLEQYVQMAFDDHSDDFANHGEEFVDMFSIERFFLSNASQMLLDDIAEHNIGNFVQYVINTRPDSLKAVEELENPELVNYLCERLALGEKFSIRKLESANERFSNVFAETYLKVQEGLREIARTVVPPSILPDEERSYRIPAGPNRIATESDYVPIETIADYIESNEVEITLEQIKGGLSRLENSYELTEDGSYLAEIYCDGMLDGLYYDIGASSLALNYDVPDANYVLFVERKPDNTVRLRLQLMKMPYGISEGSSRTQIAEALRRTFAYPQQLFDPADYSNLSYVFKRESMLATIRDVMNRI